MLPREQLQLVREQKLVLFISSSIVGQEKCEPLCQENINITVLDTILSLRALFVMFVYLHSDNVSVRFSFLKVILLT